MWVSFKIFRKVSLKLMSDSLQLPQSCIWFDLTISAVIFPKTYSSHANHFQLSHQTDVLQNLEMRSRVFSLWYSDATQMEKSLAFEEFEDSNNILVSESHSNGKRKRVKHKVSLLAKAREHVFQRADTFEPKVPTRSWIIYSSVYLPAPKYMFPRIDDLPLSVSIESPNKFQIYQNLFPHRAGDHLGWLADNVSIRLRT